MATMKRKSITPKVRRDIFNKASGKCFYCGIELTVVNYYDLDYPGSVTKASQWDVDHIHPVSKGGSNSFDNYAPACRWCNAIKKDKTLEDFRAVFFSPLATDHRFYFEREGLS
jgi:5-methylcytosine-specific restriction endonuclease McrA